MHYVREASTKFTATAQTVVSRLQDVSYLEYMELAQTCSTILLVTYLLISLAFLCFWLGWTLTIQLCRLLLWATCQPQHSQRNTECGTVQGVIDFERAASRVGDNQAVRAPLASTSDESVPDTGDNALDTAADAHSLSALDVDEASPTCVVMVPDSEALVAPPATPVKSGKHGAGSPLGPAKNHKGLVGLLTPPVSQCCRAIFVRALRRCLSVDDSILWA